MLRLGVPGWEEPSEPSLCMALEPWRVWSGTGTGTCPWSTLMVRSSTQPGETCSMTQGEDATTKSWVIFSPTGSQYFLASQCTASLAWMFSTILLGEWGGLAQGDHIFLQANQVYMARCGTRMGSFWCFRPVPSWYLQWMAQWLSASSWSCQQAGGPILLPPCSSEGPLQQGAGSLVYWVY